MVWGREASRGMLRVRTCLKKVSVRESGKPDHSVNVYNATTRSHARYKHENNLNQLTQHKLRTLRANQLFLAFLAGGSASSSVSLSSSKPPVACARLLSFSCVFLAGAALSDSKKSYRIE